MLIIYMIVGVTIITIAGTSGAVLLTRGLND
ncbi:hypothetical protein QE450_000817 [Paenibacillus sp. SORGH_AS306]|nr:hypothetical protein [Paenibacillus sp. SORGH_AS_0306]MDR6110361.1 hypothetical protein [Paenibacillus sp. SORGH_AS_0338]